MESSLFASGARAYPFFFWKAWSAAKNSSRKELTIKNDESERHSGEEGGEATRALIIGTKISMGSRYSQPAQPVRFVKTCPPFLENVISTLGLNNPSELMKALTLIATVIVAAEIMCAAANLLVSSSWRLKLQTGLIQRGREVRCRSRYSLIRP